MRKNCVGRRRVLKILGAGALGVLRVGPASTAQLAQAGTAEEPTTAQVPISIGNAGVPLMFEVWGRPPGMNLPQDLVMGNEIQFTGMLRTAKELGWITGIEYYVSWGFAEPEEGKWDWSIYKRDAQRIKESGYQYIPYVWMQNLPRWVRNNPAYPHASNVDTGLEIEALSIFADKTREAYDRFYAEFAKELGPEIDILRVGTPYDYGETAYPGGAAVHAFPMKNIGMGFWVNEPDARAHFKTKMRAEYHSLQSLNRAWATQFTSFDTLEYPRDATRKRYWLDFINWYHDAFTEELGKLLDIVRKHFPSTPLNINLGWPFEKVCLGQDLSGIVKMCAEKQVRVRTPTGAFVPFLYTKTVATAAHHYPPPKFSSEPVGGNARQKDIAAALFKDLTTGVNWHFDYADNIVDGKDLFEEYRRLWRGGAYPEIDGALFFPATAHRLEDWNNWRDKSALFSGGFPEGLMPLAEKLRDIWDYDVVDERLVNDNALSTYKMLFWPVGALAEAETLGRIYDWIERGGILLVKDLARITTVEGDAGAFAAVSRPASSAVPMKPGRMIRAGKGYVFDGQGSLDFLMTLVVHRGDLRKLNPACPARLTEFLPLDTTDDGVLISQFKQGVLLFNKTERAVTTELDYRPGAGKPAYEKRKITLPALAFRWVDGKTGEVTETRVQYTMA